MPKLSTPNLLLLFAHNETSLSQNERVIRRLHRDAKAQDVYNSIMSDLDVLNSLAPKPRASNKAVQRILSFT